jgi:hypothetical protein
VNPVFHTYELRAIIWGFQDLCIYRVFVIVSSHRGKNHELFAYTGRVNGNNYQQNPGRWLVLNAVNGVSCIHSFQL